MLTKRSTKGTYVWLFASLASSLYVNVEKSTLYKGFLIRFSGAEDPDEIFMLIVAKLPTKKTAGRDEELSSSSWF